MNQTSQIPAKKINSDFIEWSVDGMDCANCAAGITRFLERQGQEEVFVNFTTGEVRFEHPPTGKSLEILQAGLQKMGYTVVEPEAPTPFWTVERKLLVSAILAFPLLLDHLLMVLGLPTQPWFENYWVQFFWTLPVFFIGVFHFGTSAWGSLRNGMANMDVLIFLGSTAAFIYSIIGTLQQDGNLIYYETAATIIALVLLGNWIEKRAVRQTSGSIDALKDMQQVKARKIMPSGTIVEVDQKDLRIGDRVQINQGDAVPSDGTILQGQSSFDESLLTGESLPVLRQSGDRIIGGSLAVDGQVQVEITAVGKNTVLSQMIELVKTAQRDKPNIQKLADQISAIFVPVVVSLAILTLLGGWLIFQLPFTQALLNSIAVLVISCPCAMGLATPTAVTVGVGRLARMGVLVKGGQTLETFAQIQRFVFDKTGTLTTGQFRIANLRKEQNLPEDWTKYVVALEQHSSHPIAQSLVQHLSQHTTEDLPILADVQELRGLGMEGRDQAGRTWKVGSAKLLPETERAFTSTTVLVLLDGFLVAELELADDLKPEARATISYLHQQQVETVLLSGDQTAKTEQVARALGIQTILAEQNPEQKLTHISQFADEKPTAMVGDGINDAAALSRATIGVSLSDASQAAIQSAEVVLLDGKLERLQAAFGLSKLTLKTIRENLFWAFSYNLVAIPLAMTGMLNPMWAALFMAFSDVIVIGNSIRLKYRSLRTQG